MKLWATVWCLVFWLTVYISFLYTSVEKIISNTKTAAKHFHKSNIFYKKKLNSLYFLFLLALKYFKKYKTNKLRYFIKNISRSQSAQLCHQLWRFLQFPTHGLLLVSNRMRVCNWICGNIFSFSVFKAVAVATERNEILCRFFNICTHIIYCFILLTYTLGNY